MELNDYVMTSSPGHYCPVKTRALPFASIDLSDNSEAFILIFFNFRCVKLKKKKKKKVKQSESEKRDFS